MRPHGRHALAAAAFFLAWVAGSPAVGEDVTDEECAAAAASTDPARWNACLLERLVEVNGSLEALADRLESPQVTVAPDVVVPLLEQLDPRLARMWSFRKEMEDRIEEGNLDDARLAFGEMLRTVAAIEATLDHIDRLIVELEPWYPIEVCRWDVYGPADDTADDVFAEPEQDAARPPAVLHR